MIRIKQYYLFFNTECCRVDINFHVLDGVRDSFMALLKTLFFSLYSTNFFLVVILFLKIA